MKLMDEQYNQVMKFVDGEMEETQHAAFEAMLPENKALREEVGLYEQIRSLGSCIAQKLSTASLSFSEIRTSEAEEGMMMIKQAREHWENEQEDNLKRKHGLAIVSLMEELEELEDIRLYDEAKREDNGIQILFSDYLKNRKA